MGSLMGAFTPESLVTMTALAHSPGELCREWEAAVERDDGTATRYLDALAVHALHTSWGALVEGSMNGWKEVDREAVLPR